LARLDCDPPIYTSYVAGTTGSTTKTSFYWLRWGLVNFLPGLAPNFNPLSI
jgi:hypothetical protein